MKQLIEPIWDLTRNVAAIVEKEMPEVGWEENTFERFNTSFRDLYHFIQDKYMSKDVDELDRHKVAAIIVTSLIKASPLVVRKAPENDMLFLGNHYIALQIALAYMLNLLNQELRDRDLPEVDKYMLPEAFSCETNYMDIMARNLYFSENNPAWNINPLDWAERFFLLEYITLKERGIDMRRLKEKH